MNSLNIMHADYQAGLTLCTRFSIRFKTQLPTEEWIESRFALLKTITLPSLNQQTHEVFDWVILTAPEWYDKVCRLFESIDLRPGITITVETQKGLPKIAQRLHPDANAFVTMRLDSDDALHKDTLRLIYSLSRELPSASLINLPNGFRLELPTLRMMQCTFNRHYQGHFYAVKQMARDSMFLLGGPHRKAREDFRSIAHLPEAGWIQLVHGKNLVNNMPGLLRRIRSRIGVFRGPTFDILRSIKDSDVPRILDQHGIGHLNKRF